MSNVFNEFVFVGPALSCVNKADVRLGRSIPDSLRYYIHDLRVTLSSPYYLMELQPEKIWGEYDHMNNMFIPQRNSWTEIAANQGISYEIFEQPRILGVHAPNLKIDVLDISGFKKNYSIASIIEVMRWANSIYADYFVFHLCQVDRWIDDNYREFVFIPESIKVFSEFAKVYKEEGFTFVPCIEILEFPKYPATPTETKRILEQCQAILPETRLVFDMSHLWRSQALICETRKEGFEDVRFKRFPQIMEDTLNLLNPHDVYVWHHGGCWQTETHLVPGIYPDEDPFRARFRLDDPPEMYNEGFEMNISAAFELVVDFCVKSGRPLRLVLEIFEKDFNIILKAIKEINMAICRKLKRKNFVEMIREK